MEEELEVASCFLMQTPEEGRCATKNAETCQIINKSI